MQANAMPTIVDFLSRNPEPLPEWLASDNPPTFDRKTFFASRTVYYPGSGTDGQPVKLCALSHAAHTFLYVDQGVKWETIVENLSDPERGFRGYEVVCRHQITEDVLWPDGWRPHVSEQEVANADRSAEPFRRFVVLKRTDGGEDHGPRRLAILFIRGDGFTCYDALYCQRDGTPPPYLAVIQDYGFGGNFDCFGKGGLLERIARRCSVRPEFLLVGEPSKRWTGYENTEAHPEPGGCPARPRRLFRRCPA